MVTIRVCNYCKKDFKRWGKPRANSAYKFCSRICYWQSIRVPNLCKTCGKNFKRTSNDRIFYCSKKCRNNGEWGKINKILNKGRKHTEETKMKRSKISKELKTWKILFQPEIRTRAIKNSIEKRKDGTSRKGKSAIWMKGEKNPNWKGGITTMDRLERIKFRQQVQKQVFERDNYVCQNCGSKKQLQVDHIQPWAEYVELRFSMNNCRTLCMDCHYFITFKKVKPKHIIWGHNFERRVNP